MSRSFTQTHYCADATCKGFTGFEVRWAGSTQIDPAYPVDDTCPHCKAGMLDEPVEFEDAIDGLLDELLQGRAIGDYDLATLDRRAVLAAVQAELERQAREAWRARYGLQGLKGKAYDQRVDELIQEGTLPF